MKILRDIPYGKILLHALVIILAAAWSGYVWAKDGHAYLIITIPAIAFSLFRLFKLYGEIVRRLLFVFNAVQNNDSSFRFSEDPRYTKYAFVNQSLNRIKEVLDNAKLQIKEREQYFQLIMECANVGIVVVMKNGSVKQTNTKALNILGMERLTHVDQLRVLSVELCEALWCMEEKEQLAVRFATEMGEQNLALNCSAMEFDGKRLKVISIGNIQEELDRKEVESWEKLTRILTHEIMNSLAPITSISHTLVASSGDAEAVRQGLDTIHSTSDRLMRFVDSFRAVTRIPAPQKVPFYLSELLKEAISLTAHEGVELEVSIEPEDTMLYADRALMSQVMINLLKNAVEALATFGGRGKISIRSTIDAEERIQIEITNNGTAIPAEVAENIFTPFFTTKPDGSGIGLAVSRQIIRLHGGNLRLKHNDAGRVTFAVVLE